MTETVFDHDRRDAESNLRFKVVLKRIVAMLTRMAMKFDDVAESDAPCRAVVDYEQEHRFAEHEHQAGESQNEYLYRRREMRTLRLGCRGRSSEGT